MKTEENELLCRVGEDTPMGKLLRNFWTPAFLSSALPMKDSDPVRVRLFGERFVAFRGDDGRIGFLDEGCPHRGASLVLANQEGCALRCLYHGWKVDASGEILETPNAEREMMAEDFRARAYPVEESHGIVWVWMGDPDQVPPRPTYLWESKPVENTLAVDVDLDCNWVQSLEGLLDSAHTGILHKDILTKFPDAVVDGRAMQRALLPRLEVELTDFGMHYAAIRSNGGMEEGKDQIRVTTYAAPFICFIPPDGQVFISVPIDDFHTKFINLWWDDNERLDAGPGYDRRINVWGLTTEILAATGMGVEPQPIERMVPHNHFPQDREAMRRGESFTGLPGITAEDAAIAISMGAVVDRRKEHLVASDVAITRARRMLMRAAQHVENGGLHVDWQGGKTPFELIRSKSGEIEPGEDWHILVPEHVSVGRSYAGR